jgi:hypothetical protein
MPVDRPLRGDAVNPALRDINAAYPAVVRRLLRSQVDLDIIDEEAIIAATLRDGALEVADEQYRVIVLPPLFALGLDAARALAAFVRAGGLLVSTGALPQIAESADKTAALQQEFLSLFGPDGPAYVKPLEQLADFLRAQRPADLVLAEPNENILYTHRCLEGRDLYFIANNAPHAVTIQPRLRVPGPYTVYRPVDGSVGTAGSGESAPALELAEYEGVFVVA